MNLHDFIITEVKLFFENFSFKGLEQKFRKTLPKIPTRDVFYNKDVFLPFLVRQNADKYFENDNFKRLPYISVDVTKIVPTQKFLNINNLKDVKNISTDTEAFLLKLGELYYVLDGHHRISMNILNGQPMINAYVYDNELNNK